MSTQDRLKEAARLSDMDYLQFLGQIDALSRPTIQIKSGYFENLKKRLGTEGTEELVEEYRIAGSQTRP